MNVSSCWEPTATIKTLKKRARILQKIRAFFEDRNIVEVETPQLSEFSITDPAIESMSVNYVCDAKKRTGFLQTSPEFAMKRLLAAGVGDCYQLCHVFRSEERGHLHNTEFTLLEWYRTGFDDKKLITEIDVFLQTILNTEPAKKYSYQDLFKNYLNLDPITCNREQAKTCAEKSTTLISDLASKEAYLQLLFCEIIEAEIGKDAPCFVTDFPAEQAALARINENDDRLSCRFEVYYQGVELGNGFYELADPEQQYTRFLQDNRIRKRAGQSEVSIDPRFMAALKAGLPDCAGVAIGIDRLIMIACKLNRIEQVMAFTAHNA